VIGVAVGSKEHNMAETKDYHLSDILSVTTGVLVSSRKMDGIYDILAWMAGEGIYTNQIRRVIGEAAPVILKMHPQLAEVTLDEISPNDIPSWLADKIARFGEMLPVPRMTADQHERIDAQSELLEKMHPDRIIVT
jgi:hypothetical protein